LPKDNSSKIYLSARHVAERFGEHDLAVVGQQSSLSQTRQVRMGLHPLAAF
jgi:hypothetical protein